MKKIEAQYYTIDTICNLYQVKKDEYASTPIEIEDYKQQKAVFNLLDKVILKFRKSLLNNEHKKVLKFKIEYYQAFYLSRFLYQNYTEYTGIAEQTLLQHLAFNIDKEL